MADMTKRKFLAVLCHASNPKLSQRDLGRWCDCTQYTDILLDYSKFDQNGLAKEGMTVTVTLESPHSIVLATVRWNRMNQDDRWDLRFNRKMEKYKRWLEEAVEDAVAGL